MGNKESKVKWLPMGKQPEHKPNSGMILKTALRKTRTMKGKRFSFGGLLTQFLRGHKIEEEASHYRPHQDLKGLDITKTKEPEGQHDLVLSIAERNARNNSYMSHIYGIEMLQLRALSRVGPGLEPLNDDDPTDDKQAHNGTSVQGLALHLLAQRGAILMHIDAQCIARMTDSKYAKVQSRF
ncbi:hypothetical protein HAX54_009346, partial [Datura stramonium]|nr:hypothetical protein [Datura stramonium]